MSKELVISSNRHETRVAMIEDDEVVEVYHQRENEYSLAGSIHKGRVTRVLPGMQSAFVDIGLDRDAFLYVSDFFEDNEEYDKIVTSVEDKVLKQLDRPLPQSLVSVPPAVPAESEASEAAVESADAAPAAEDAAPAPLPVPPGVDAAPLPEQRREDLRRDDSRRDDRDRRGRRSRRRRGPKGGGRGLPDSKYYSPRGGEGDSAPRELAPELPPRATAPVETVRTPAAEEDDFLVLPGESLAKYAGGPDEPPEEADVQEKADDEPEYDEPASEILAEALAEAVAAANAEPVAEPAEETAGELPEDVSELREEREPVSEIAAEPPAEPQPELAAAMEMMEEAQQEAEAPAEPASAPEELAAAEESVETSEDVDVIPSDAAEPVEASEPGAEAVELAPEAQEADAAPESPEGETVEPLVEEEGPEPARIPTSLTATLREQGPRYLHRVSRRMRRRGRDGRDAPQDSPRPDPGRGMREPRPHEAGPRSAIPEQRPAPAAPVKEAVAPRPDKAASPSISDLLREGQEIIVQIAKEPLGQKGARITSHIALPGRFLVYMPTVDHIGVSRKIPSDDERMRLKRILQSNRSGIPGGYIVRTAGEGRSEEELRADMMFLYNLWLDMRQKAERKPAPLLIHHDLNVVERVLRDQLTSAFKSVWVDNEEAYESVLRFVQRFQPALVNRVKMYTRSTPIFDEFGITAELEKALRPKVWLKSGGYIVINQTEALVAIDVNTGKFVGKSNRLEDTIVKTNTDAIREIVRQIRLRDLGGIIVVDFIDMDERKNRQKVMQALEEAMRADRAPYKILQFNDFGLVAITRKRVKQSLERTLCMPCPYCEGAGYVKSAQTVVGEVLQEAGKIAKVVEGKEVMLRVAPEVARLLKSNQNTYLQEMEEILGRTVIVKSDPQLHLEKFDLA